MSVFNHLDYRKALQERLEQRKSKPGHFTMAKLAEKIGIQASYLTHVLKGRAHFNSDQIFAMCEQLNCTEAESRYLLLLLEHERSAHPTRKAKLKTEIDQIRARSMKTEEHVSARKIDELNPSTIAYYLDPLCQLVHVFLNFSEYARDPRLLASKLGLGEGQISDVLGRLESAGYIEAHEAGYKVLIKNKHLPKDSPLCHPHQFLMRYKSIDQMQRLKPEDRQSFSVTFSATPEDKDAIHRAFLDFVKAAEKIVKASRREKVYQINFDLFPWESA